MAKTAGDVLVKTLLNWNVDTISGIPGDGVNEIIDGHSREVLEHLLPGLPATRVALSWKKDKSTNQRRRQNDGDVRHTAGNADEAISACLQTGKPS